VAAFPYCEVRPTWKTLIRFRTKVGARRSRKLIAELPSTIENIGTSDQQSVPREPRLAAARETTAEIESHLGEPEGQAMPPKAR